MPLQIAGAHLLDYKCHYPDQKMHLHHHQNLNIYSVTSSKLSRQSCHFFSFWMVKNLPEMYVRQQGQGFCFVLFANPLSLSLYKKLAPNLLLKRFTSHDSRDKLPLQISNHVNSNKLSNYLVTHDS